MHLYSDYKFQPLSLTRSEYLWRTDGTTNADNLARPISERGWTRQGVGTGTDLSLA